VDARYPILSGDLKSKSGTATISSIGPTISHVFDFEGTQHVFYKARRRISTSSSSDGGAGRIQIWGSHRHRRGRGATSHVFNDDRTQMTTAPSTCSTWLDNHIIELWWRGIRIRGTFIC
jgi:hypothetical protein